jgi:hypothetical protein
LARTFRIRTVDPSGLAAHSCSEYRQSRLLTCPDHTNLENRVPAGALSTKYDRAPCCTRPARTTFAVTNPRSPGPSGLQARFHIIPRCAKFSNACVENSVRSAWQALIVNSLPVAVPVHERDRTATTAIRTTYLKLMTA